MSPKLRNFSLSHPTTSSKNSSSSQRSAPHGTPVQQDSKTSLHTRQRKAHQAGTVLAATSEGRLHMLVYDKIPPQSGDNNSRFAWLFHPRLHRPARKRLRLALIGARHLLGAIRLFRSGKVLCFGK